MTAERIFVGRKAELAQFKKVLEDPRGQAVLVVGQAGMGKSMLVNEVIEQAEQGVLGQKPLKVKCWSVSYQITPTDDVNKTMEQIILDATDAASPMKKKLGMTGQSKDKWRALFGASEVVPFLGKKVKVFGDLLLSWGHQKAGDTRTRFVKALAKLSDCMSDEKRAIFIIDPEKCMPKESDHTWRLVVSDLPDRIKLIFPQRPDDALVISDDFCLMKKVKRVPSDELDVLDDQAIDDLMDKYSKRTKYSTNKLHDAVSRYRGHPYAVGAALELIEDGLEIEKLPSDPRPVTIAEAQWRRICERGDDAIKLFEAYAILEVGVPDEVVQKVSGLDAPTRKRLQKDSYLRGLLREDGYGKRIYHAILSDYILDQMDESEKKNYHKRAVEVYRQKLAEAKKQQIMPDALAATRLAKHVLLAEGETAFVQTFIDECTPPLLSLGLLDSAIALSDQALACIEKSSAEEGVLLGNLGLIYRWRGDIETAEQMCKKSLEIEEKLGRLESMASTYNNLGAIYQMRGDLDKAEQMYNEALEINEKLGRLEGMAAQYGNLGLISQIRGDLNKAEQMLAEALEINERLGRLESMAVDYGNLGQICGTRGDLDKAERMYTEALEISNKLGRLDVVAAQYGNLGVIHQTRGDLATAEQMYNRSLQIDQKLGRLEGMARSYGNLGLIYRMRGDLDRAELMHTKALAISKKLEWTEGIAEQYANLAVIHGSRGDLDKAKQMLAESLEINEKLGRLEGMARQYLNLGLICRQRGDIENTRGLWEKALEIFKKIGMKPEIEKVQRWIDELKTEDGGQKTDDR